MQSFKSTNDPSEVDHMEDLSLPGDDLSGEVENFSNATAEDLGTGPNSKSATFKSTGNGLDIVTGTQPIERNDPQTLIIRYRNTGANPVNIEPIDSSGSEIDDTTDYTLGQSVTTEMDDYTLAGEDYNIATIPLSDSEQTFVNDYGELFVEYSSDSSSELQVFCQSVVSGSIDYSTETCGVEAEEDTFETGVVNWMEVSPSAGPETVSDTDTEPLYVNGGESVDISFEVENTGNTAITEQAYLFSNVDSTGDLSGSESERFIEETDYNTSNEIYYDETVTANFDNSHSTDDMTFGIRGEANSGEIEVDINGQRVTFNNLSGNRSVNVNDYFNLSETTDTYDITVETRSGSFDGSPPQVDEVQLIAEDPAVSSDYSPKSVSLDPGETQVLTYSNIDVGTQERLLTFRSMFSGSMKEVQVEVESSSDDSPVANAGGDYTVELPYAGVREQQTGIKRIQSASDPGAEWTQVTSTPITTATTTRENVVSLNRAPEYVSPNASSSDIEDAIQDWQDDGYMHSDLAEYFPEDADPSNWEPKSVNYKDVHNIRQVTETESKMGSRFGSDYQDAGWTQTGEAGVVTTGYDTRWVTAQRTTQSNEISITDESFGTTANTSSWYPVKQNRPEEIWTGNTTKQEDGYLVKYEESVTDSIAAEYPDSCETPDSGSTDGIVECDDIDEDGVTWVRSDEPVTVEESGETTTETQCSTFAPGTEWEMTSNVCSTYPVTSYQWEKTSPSEVTYYYRWDRTENVANYLFYRPNLTETYKYEQELYKIDIIFEKSSTGEVHEYEGPRYSYVPEFRSQNLQLDASESQPSEGETIVDYEWDFGGEGEQPIYRISDLTDRTVELKITDSAGLTDTDTAKINVEPGCTNFTSECTWSHGIDSLDVQAPEKVDMRYGFANIDVTASAPAGLNENWEIVIEPSATDNIRMSEGQKTCPNGYTKGQKSDAPSSVDESKLNAGTTYCFKTDAGGFAEKYFKHPYYEDDVTVDDVRQTAASLYEEKQIWEGASMPQEETYSTRINPRLNDAIGPGETQFTVTARQTELNEKIEEEVTVEFCVADSPQWVCPGLDSDFDGTNDGTDDCPYDPLFTEVPCEYRPDFDEGEGYIEFGDSTETTGDNWNITQQDASIEVGRDTPSGMPSKVSSAKQLYPADTLQLGYSTDPSTNGSNHNNLIAYYPFDQYDVPESELSTAWEPDGPNWTLYDYSGNGNHANIWMYDVDDSLVGTDDPFAYTDDPMEARPIKVQGSPVGSSFRFNGRSYIEVLNYNNSHSVDSNFSSVRSDLQNATENGTYTISYWASPDFEYSKTYSGVDNYYRYGYSCEDGEIVGYFDDINSGTCASGNSYTGLNSAFEGATMPIYQPDQDHQQFVNGLYLSNYTSADKQLYHGNYFSQYSYTLLGPDSSFPDLKERSFSERDYHNLQEGDLSDPELYGSYDNSHWAGKPYSHTTANTLECQGSGSTYDNCIPTNDTERTQGGYTAYFDSSTDTGYTEPSSPSQEWYHYFHTQNGNVMENYVNGQYIGSTDREPLSWNIAADESGMEMFIGAGWEDPNSKNSSFEMFNGRISDLRIYDKSIDIDRSSPSNSYLTDVSYLRYGDVRLDSQNLFNDGNGNFSNESQAVYPKDEIYVQSDIEFRRGDGFVTIELQPVNSSGNNISGTLLYQEFSDGTTQTVNNITGSEEIAGFRADVRLSRYSDHNTTIKVNHFRVYNHDPTIPDGDVTYDRGSLEKNANPDSNGDYTQSKFNSGESLEVTTSFNSTISNYTEPVQITYMADGKEIMTTTAEVSDSLEGYQFEERKFYNTEQISRQDLIDAGLSPDDNNTYTLSVRIEPDDENYYDKQRVEFSTFWVPE
jgi:hypothetical protein